MGTEKRNRTSESLEFKNRPGPGSYVSKTFIGEGPKIGIKPRNDPKPSENSKSPGPGAYQPNISAVIEKSPSIGLGHGKRGGALGNSNSSSYPGPGYYPLKEIHEGPKFGFGSSKRKPEKISNVPGPGKYEIPSTVGELPPHERSKHN